MRKPESNYCPVCGQQVERVVVPGYATARELGRPAGAKGSDTSYIEQRCSMHGVVTPITNPTEVQAYCAWESWVESLPDKLDNETLIDKGRGLITDLWGNTIMSIPSREMGLTDLRKTVEDN